jgi:hypothetical protein
MLAEDEAFERVGIIYVSDQVRCRVESGYDCTYAKGSIITVIFIGKIPFYRLKVEAIAARPDCRHVSRCLSIVHERRII